MSAVDPGPAATELDPTGRLAISLQEVFVVVIRLRGRKASAPDSASFRRQVKRLLLDADAEARAAGYPKEIVRLAVYACIALLDESVLSSSQAAFGDWPSQPLQSEIFGDLRAGDTFYRNMNDLFASPNSHAIADVLEVYLLCLLLGFHGRYTSSDSGDRHALMQRAQERIAEVRGPPAALSPGWRPPPDEDVRDVRDPWIRRLTGTAALLLLLALLLFVASLFLLPAGTRELTGLARSVAG